jgi:uncharacterized protein YraI
VQQRRAVAVIAATVAVASVVGAACADLTASGTNETLVPLVPDRSGPPITQVPTIGPDGQPVVNTQGSTTTLPREQAPAELAADDTDAVSVAARFLAAAASGDDATAAALEVPGRSPTTTEWARAAFAEYTQVAGASVWGAPTCNDPAGPTIACSWLQSEAPPTLILVQQDGNWLVSHPLFNVAAAPQQAGTGCIEGSANVNVRGGPGTNWPRVAQIPPGTCSVPIFDAVHTDTGTGDRWRMIELDGQRAWIIERVINM